MISLWNSVIAPPSQTLITLTTVCWKPCPKLLNSFEKLNSLASAINSPLGTKHNKAEFPRMPRNSEFHRMPRNCWIPSKFKMRLELWKYGTGTETQSVPKLQNGSKLQTSSQLSSFQFWKTATLNMYANRKASIRCQCLFWKDEHFAPTTVANMFWCSFKVLFDVLGSCENMTQMKLRKRSARWELFYHCSL